MQRLTALLLPCPCPCPCSPAVHPDDSRMRPLDEQQQQPQVATTTATAAAAAVQTPPITLHPLAHKVTTVLQVDTDADADDCHGNGRQSEDGGDDDPEPYCPVEVIVRAMPESDDSDTADHQCDEAFASIDQRLPDPLHLSVLEFHNAYNLFKACRRAITGHLLSSLDDKRRLHNNRDSLDSLSQDRGLLLVDGSLVNLKEMQLTDLTIGDETFAMIRCNCPRLTRLTVSNCKIREHEQHSVGLQSPYGLDELVVRDVNLTDDYLRRILPFLHNLRILKLSYCNVNDVMLMAVVTHLPRLTCLEVNASNGEDLTDTGLEGLVEHRPCMTELWLENVQLTDTGVQKISRCMPNLCKLKVSSASIGDDTLATVADLAAITMLDLRGAHATDEGLALLTGRLGPRLEELQLDSGSFTETGMLQAVIDSASNLRSLIIDASESTKRICFQGEEQPSLQLTVNDSDLLSTAVKRFRDLDSLTVTSPALSGAILLEAAPFQTKLTCLYLTGSGIDDAAILTVGTHYPRLRRLNLYDTVISSAAVGEFMQQSLDDLEELYVENKEFLTSDVIVQMAAAASSSSSPAPSLLLTRLRSCQLVDNQSGQLMVFTNDGMTDLRLGGPSIDDRVLDVLMLRFDKVERLRLKETVVTEAAIVRAVTSSSSSLLDVRELALLSAGIGDESLKCIGDRLANLTELMLKSALVTDDGLASLSEDLVSRLEVFEVSESSVTDVGVRQLVTKMKSIRTLDVFDNPNVNEGIREFLHELLPHMGFIVAPVHQDEDGQQDEHPLIGEEE